jgi:hypothetical protein
MFKNNYLQSYLLGKSLTAGVLPAISAWNWTQVPHKGSAAGITDMLGGQIHSQFTTHIKREIAKFAKVTQDAGMSLE